MAYLVKHITSSSYNDLDHARKVQEALEEIGEAEIYSVQHSLSQVQYGSSSYSTLIIYREYDKE